ncbi:mycothione reductase [Salsipaludibacter albus]|uniref:mycothione reductase n=1 Tax=Salsipaludibacter albus TaxID=2849650 RepID=UPI001EE4B488|nr:mycothione reductase [Salsipaludibacter albus]
MTTHDLIIIGSGSGNSLLTPDYDDWHVALVEDGPLGGTCLNRGCIPSKMLVHTADRARIAATSDRFGIDTSFAGADWPAIRDRIFGRIDPIAASGEVYREQADNVDLFKTHGRFVGHKDLAVDDQVISADTIVLAAGAHVHVPAIPGLADVDFHTSDTIMRADELPARTTIIGGGFVGVEMGHVLAALGSEVTMLVRRAGLVTDEDPEVSRRITAAYGRRLDLRLGTSLVEVEQRGDEVVVITGDGEVVGDALLVATGRTPNGRDLGVERTGVELDGEGYVVVDDHGRTTADGIWALGDISSPQQLKHKANADARLVAHNIVHPEDLRSLDLGPVPHAVFGDPQVASVGMTEPEARAAGIDCAIVVHDYASTAYGWAMEDTSSIVKLLADRDTHLLVGAHVIGPQASTLIQQLIQGMRFGQTVEQLARDQWWIHPALPEVVEQALLAFDW